LGFCWSLIAVGQTPATAVSPELQSAPPAITVAADSIATTVKKPTVTKPGFTPGKMQYSFAVGSQFSRFGTAAYFQPSILFPVTNRFRAFASVSFINTMGASFGRQPLDAGYPGATSFARQHYVVHAGGNYMVNERLNLTGSIWRDFSNRNYLPYTSMNAFSPGGTSGMLLRANYKITENLSISGGFRYSNGNNFINPFYQDYSPFGF
jgi:hypothetical protein